MTAVKAARRRKSPAITPVRKSVDLSLTGLNSIGAFTGAPVKKTIQWRQGNDEFEAIVYVRLLGYQAAVSDVMTLAGKQDQIAGRIASSICDASGREVFTVADIVGEASPDRGPLDGNLTLALMLAIHEVNNLGKTTS